MTCKFRQFLFLVVICFLANFFTISIFVLYFLLFFFLFVGTYGGIFKTDRLSFVEAKLDLLIHHLNQRIHNDSLMEQGVFAVCGFWYQDDLVYENLSCMPITPQKIPYQGSSNPTF